MVRLATKTLLVYEAAYDSREAYELHRVCDLIDNILEDEVKNTPDSSLNFTFPDISFEDNDNFANYWCETPTLLNALDSQRLRALTNALKQNGYTVNLSFDSQCVKTLTIGW